MEVIIKEKDLEELITQGKNKGKYKTLSKDKKFIDRLADVYNTMCSVEKVSDLACYSYLHYEKLKYQYAGTSSVRIVKSRVERLLFTENDNGIEITLLEIEEDHYGNKK